MPRIAVIALIAILTFININNAQGAQCTLPFVPEALVSGPTGGWYVFTGGREGNIRYSKFGVLSRKLAVEALNAGDGELRTDVATMFPNLKRFDVAFSSLNGISFINGRVIQDYEWDANSKTFKLGKSFADAIPKQIIEIRAVSMLKNSAQNILVIGKSAEDGNYHDFILDQQFQLIPDGEHPPYPDDAPIPTSLTIARDHIEENHSDMLMFYKAFVGSIGYDHDFDRLHVSRPLLHTWKLMEGWRGCPLEICFDGELDGAAVSNYHDTDPAKRGENTIHLFRGPFYYRWDVTNHKGFGTDLVEKPTMSPKLIQEQFKAKSPDKEFIKGMALDTIIDTEYHLYLFSGDTMFGYSDDAGVTTERYDGLSKIFDGLPRDLDAGFTTPIHFGGKKTYNTYFIKGETFYRYHFKKYQGNPLVMKATLKDMFGGSVPSRSDAATNIYDFNQEKVAIVFSGNFYYKVKFTDEGEVQKQDVTVNLIASDLFNCKSHDYKKYAGRDSLFKTPYGGKDSDAFNKWRLESMNKKPMKIPKKASCTIPFVPEALVNAPTGGWYAFAGGRNGFIRFRTFAILTKKLAIAGLYGERDGKARTDVETMFPNLKRFDHAFSSAKGISFIDGNVIQDYVWDANSKTFKLGEKFVEAIPKVVTEIKAVAMLKNPSRNILLIGKSSEDGKYHDFILDQQFQLIPDGVHPAYPDDAPIPTSLTLARDHPEENHSDMLMFYKAFVGSIGYDHGLDRVHVSRPLLHTWKLMDGWRGCPLEMCFDGEIDSAAVSNYHDDNPARHGENTIHLFRGHLYYRWDVHDHKGFGTDLVAMPTHPITLFDDEFPPQKPNFAFPKGMPLDTVIDTEYHLFFFSGNSMYGYSDDLGVMNDKYDGLNTIFDGLPSDLDAGFTTPIHFGGRKTYNTYFIKGDTFYRYHFKKYQGNPLVMKATLKDMFGGSVPSRSDAATNIYDFNKEKVAIIFSGNFYYKVTFTDDGEVPKQAVTVNLIASDLFHCEAHDYSSEKYAGRESLFKTPGGMTDPAAFYKWRRDSILLVNRNPVTITDFLKTPPKAGSDTFDPKVDTLKPNGDIVKPNGDTVKPNGDTLKPNGDTLKPNGDIVKPNGDTVKPNGETLKPNGDTLKPSDNASKPAGDIVKPNGDTLKPNGDTLKPNGDTLKPNGDVVKPNGDTQKPNGDIVKPTDTPPSPPLPPGPVVYMPPAGVPTAAPGPAPAATQASVPAGAPARPAEDPEASRTEESSSLSFWEWLAIALALLLLLCLLLCCLLCCCYRRRHTKVIIVQDQPTTTTTTKNLITNETRNIETNRTSNMAASSMAQKTSSKDATSKQIKSKVPIKPSAAAVVVPIAAKTSAGATTSGKNVRDSTSKETSVRDTSFRGTNVQDSAFLGAGARDSFYQGADTNDTTFQDTNVQDSAFLGSNVRDSSSQGSDINDSTLQGSNVRDSTSRGANVRDSTSQGSDVNDSTLQGSNVRDSATTNRTSVQDLAFLGTNVRESTSQGSDANNSTSRGANVQGAAFRGANVRDSSYQGSDVNDATFQGTNVQDSAFLGANVRDASSPRTDANDLQRSNVRDSTSRGTNVQDLAFLGSNIRGLSSQGRDARDSSFQGSNVNGSTFQGSNVRDSSFRSTNVQDSSYDGTNVSRSTGHTTHVPMIVPHGSSGISGTGEFVATDGFRPRSDLDMSETENVRTNVRHRNMHYASLGAPSSGEFEESDGFRPRSLLDMSETNTSPPEPESDSKSSKSKSSK